MEQVQTKKPSLFDLAKKAPATKAASKAKDLHEIEGISEQLIRLKAARGEMEVLKAEIALLEGELKPQFRDKYIDIYMEQKRRPESFKVTGEKGGEMLVIVQDKYLKVEDEKAAILEKFPGVLERRNTYTFNSDILSKHEDAVTDAIMGLDIPDADKLALLTVKQEQFVTKGTIDRLMQYEDPYLICGLISPILMLK